MDILFNHLSHILYTYSIVYFCSLINCKCTIICVYIARTWIHLVPHGHGLSICYWLFILQILLCWNAREKHELCHPECVGASRGCSLMKRGTVGSWNTCWWHCGPWTWRVQFKCPTEGISLPGRIFSYSSVLSVTQQFTCVPMLSTRYFLNSVILILPLVPALCEPSDPILPSVPAPHEPDPNSGTVSDLFCLLFHVHLSASALTDFPLTPVCIVRWSVICMCLHWCYIRWSVYFVSRPY